MRLIDADKLLTKLSSSSGDTWARDIKTISVWWSHAVKIKDNFVYLIENEPTVDAVEVVRCRECLRERHCKFTQYQGMNGYCSLGERICDECVECDYYWANNDTGEECQGLAKPCHEFIPKRGL